MRRSNNDVLYAAQNVRFWHKADIELSSANVRIWGQSGHRDFRGSRLLLTQSGHEGLRIAATRRVGLAVESIRRKEASSPRAGPKTRVGVN
jgi:hypothetical protein